MDSTHCSFDPRCGLGIGCAVLCRLLLRSVARRLGQGLALLAQVCHCDSLRSVSKGSYGKKKNGLTQVCLFVTLDWVVICGVEVVEHDTWVRDLDVGLREHISIASGMSILGLS